MLQYLKQYFTLIVRLSLDQYDEINFMGYVLLGVRDVFQNGRQDGRHVGF